MKWNKYAFISYQRRDERAARWLSRRMKCYHLPSHITNEFVDSRRLIPIWRDREKLTSVGFPGNELPPVIKQALDESKYLIVFCTHNSSSETIWVDKEVEYFLSSHDLSYVVPYVPPVKGLKDEYYYVPALRKAIEDKRKEINDPGFDIININHKKEELEPGLYPKLFPKLFRYEKSYVRVIARVLELEFDSLWDEHKKFLRAVIGSIVALIIMSLMLWAYFGLTISASVTIKDAFPNDSLPQARNIVVRIVGAEYPLQALDTTVTLTDIPGKYRFCNLPISIEATYFKPLHTTLNMGMGFCNKYELNMNRDSTFAIFHGIVTDNRGIPVDGADVMVGNKKSITNEKGEFRIVFDVEQQSQTKHLRIEKVGVGINDNMQESPDSSKFILK